MSLFSGVAGLDLGIRRWARPVLYCELEAFAAAVLVARMEEEALDLAPVFSDVRRLDATRWRGSVDLVVGGWPCVGHSQAGKRKGLADPRSGLWRHYARIVGEARPTFVFAENVSSLVGSGLDVVLQDLSSLGYDAVWNHFTATQVGAPHRRSRIFLLAWRRELADAQRAGLEGRALEHAREEREAAERGGRPVGDADDARGRGRSKGARREARDGAARPGSVGDSSGVRRHEGERREREEGRRPEPRHAGRQDVADSDGFRERQQDDEVEAQRGARPWADAGRGGELPLAYSDRERFDRQRRDADPRGERQAQRNDTDGRRSARSLADAVCRELRDESGWSGRSGREDEAELGELGEDVADAYGERRQGDGLHVEGREGHVAADAQGSRARGGGRSSFPPGPDRIHEWDGPKPAFRRAPRESAGGVDASSPVAFREDRLRALGNVVLPAQAELAFRTLWRVAFGEAPP